MKKEVFYDELVRLVAEPQEEWIKKYKDFFDNGDKKLLYKQKSPPPPLVLLISKDWGLR
jgi:ATP-dependent protease Clp ATPase subunit